MRSSSNAGGRPVEIGGKESNRLKELAPIAGTVRIRLVDVPKRILSANKFMTTHWRRYWLYKKAWHAVLSLIFRSAKPGYEKPEKAVVRIVSWRKRVVDFDNLVNGVKPILDWLKIAGWIMDDDPQHIELIVSQQNSREDITTIELLERKTERRLADHAGPGRLGRCVQRASPEQVPISPRVSL